MTYFALLCIYVCTYVYITYTLYMQYITILHIFQFQFLISFYKHITKNDLTITKVCPVILSFSKYNPLKQYCLLINRMTAVNLQRILHLQLSLLPVVSVVHLIYIMHMEFSYKTFFSKIVVMEQRKHSILISIISC